MLSSIQSSKLDPEARLDLTHVPGRETTRGRNRIPRPLETPRSELGPTRDPPRRLCTNHVPPGTGTPLGSASGRA